MKKFLSKLFVAIMSLSIMGTASAIEKPEVTDHEKINVYIFRGSGCSHCYDALTFLYGLNGEYDDYINVVTYEVWGNSENAAFAKAVAAKLGDEFGGVPYIVIGDQSFAGFGSSTGSELIEQALKAYKSKKYKDVVSSVLKTGKYDVTSETLEEAAFAEGITEVEPTIIEEESNDTWLVIAIFVVIIGGFGALIYSSRRK